MKEFKILYTKKVIPDVIQYIKDYIKENPKTEILIGSDSQSYGTRKTVYGVVVGLYEPGHGAHVIYTKEVVKSEMNLPLRLVNEVWKSIEVAEYLRENGVPRAKFIDIDLNPDPRYNSNSVLRQAMGMVTGGDYKVRCKHEGAMMTYTADYVVRH